MPGRRTHRALGAAVSVGIAMTQWDEFPEIGKLLYALGAGTGGTVGGVLPDVLEPALHSYHRDVFHSLFTGGGVVAVGYKSAKTLGAELRADAARLRSLRLALPDNHPDRFGLSLRECLIYRVGFLPWVDCGIRDTCGRGHDHAARGAVGRSENYLTISAFLHCGAPLFRIGTRSARPSWSGN